MSNVAIIGGTGLDKLKFFNHEISVNENEYGSAYYSDIDGVIYMPRHSVNHTVAPSIINYRANIECLRELGVKKVISMYAVGSITDKLKPSEWGVVSDFMDFTGRDCSFFLGGQRGVKHVDMSQPFDTTLIEKIKMYSPASSDIIYVTTSGPRLETKSEILACRYLGGDVVGMTLAQEATLMKEAGIPNASIVYSINWACGVKPDEVSFLTHEELYAMLDKLLVIARDVLLS